MQNRDESNFEELTVDEKLEMNLDIILDDITPDMVRTIFRKLYLKAKEGEMEAIELWLGYAAGQPRRIVDLEGDLESPPPEEGEEWKRDW